MARWNPLLFLAGFHGLEVCLTISPIRSLFSRNTGANDCIFTDSQMLKQYSSSIQHGSAFKFRFFGKTIVAISSPTAVSDFLRDHSGAFDAIHADNIQLLTGINVGDDRILHVYSVLVGRASAPTHRAMMPSNLPAISSRFTQDLLKGLYELDLSAPQVSLNEYVHRTMYNASSTAFFGPDFPLDTYDDFMTFDHGSPLISRHLGMFAKSATAARDALYAAWNRHIVGHWIPEEEGRLEGAVDMMTNIYRGLSKADLTPEEIYRLMGLIIWTIHANVLGLTIWVMCHLLTDRDTYTSVCQEIRAFVDEKFPHIEDIAQVNPKALEGNGLPLLNSFIREVIRTKTSFGVTRIATRDAVIRDEGDKAILIRKGELVSVNVQGMHFSPELHSEPEAFKADRFVEEEAPYKLFIFGMGKHNVRPNFLFITSIDSSDILFSSVQGEIMPISSFVSLSF